MLGVLASLTTKKYSELAAGLQKGEKRRKNCEALGQLPANLQLFMENTSQCDLERKLKGLNLMEQRFCLLCGTAARRKSKI